MKYLILILLLFPFLSNGQFHINPYRFTTIAPGLPGDISGNTFALGVRRLKAAYAGSCIKVRRSTDNATQDIGFSGDDFDAAAFSTFIGGGNGYVDTWYDQSGNAYNAAQATTANQPQIILNHKNGHPSLYFDGTDFLTVASSTAIFNYLHSTTGSFSIVAQVGITADPDAVYVLFGNNASASPNRGMYFGYDDRAAQSRNNAYLTLVTKGTSGQIPVSDIVLNTITPNVYSLIQNTINPANASASLRNKVYVNGTPATSTNALTVAVSTGNATYNMQIGAAGTGTLLFVGYMSEIVFYNTLLSAGVLSLQATEQNTYWAIY